MLSTFFSIPVPPNGFTILSVGHAGNLGLPWCFLPLNFWLTRPWRIWVLLSSPACSCDLPSGSWASLKVPHSHSPVGFHSIPSLPTSIPELLNHSRLKIREAHPVRSEEYPVHPSVAVGETCSRLCPLCSAVCLLYDNRCSVSVCRTIAALDWEVCAKYFANYTACTGSFNKRRKICLGGGFGKVLERHQVVLN